ncbi:bifunctional 4-hydroxy-2-oxoglutarate aldolase/2-dehydro-3-deoxy-phosphogluconate aldolase [bacterium]|nr:bifunctional 4-hydroxy-2-oxoglutarate aldolase/2-dehydro-3-deoxy-phosphogluconate aldolase [bacterium]
MDYSFLDNNKIVPVVVINKIEDAIPTLQALTLGGIRLAEITFRTACAGEAIRIARANFPDMIIGAGTVINETQCKEAIDNGAVFIVSPGISKKVSKVCKDHDIPYIPGVVTPTEIITALEDGYNILKFFPAESYGGINTLRALSAAFPNVCFMPTGGVDENNMQSYLKLPFVKAIGGSFMLKGSYKDIEAKSRLAVYLTEEI